jgi:hypothetical protein
MLLFKATVFLPIFTMVLAILANAPFWNKSDSAWSIASREITTGLDTDFNTLFNFKMITNPNCVKPIDPMKCGKVGNFTITNDLKLQVNYAEYNNPSPPLVLKNDADIQAFFGFTTNQDIYSQIMELPSAVKTAKNKWDDAKDAVDRVQITYSVYVPMLYIIIWFFFGRWIYFTFIETHKALKIEDYAAPVGLFLMCVCLPMVLYGIICTSNLTYWLTVVLALFFESGIALWLHTNSTAQEKLHTRHLWIKTGETLILVVLVGVLIVLTSVTYAVEFNDFENSMNIVNQKASAFHSEIITASKSTSAATWPVGFDPKKTDTYNYALVHQATHIKDNLTTFRHKASMGSQLALQGVSLVIFLLSFMLNPFAKEDDSTHPADSTHPLEVRAHKHVRYQLCL